jgi:hypothetical protein
VRDVSVAKSCAAVLHVTIVPDVQVEVVHDNESIRTEGVGSDVPKLIPDSESVARPLVGPLCMGNVVNTGASNVKGFTIVAKSVATETTMVCPGP